MLFNKNKIFESKLYDQDNFYKHFINDLKHSQKEVIIESPFITSSRMELLYPIFRELLERNIAIHIITRDPIEHGDEFTRYQTTDEILCAKDMGIGITLLRGHHHRKLAIIDQCILWEGSLNILSHRASLEIMRRIESEEIVTETLRFLKFNKIK